MANYATWDLYSLGKRIIEWRERAKAAKTGQQLASYAGELIVLEREFNKRFFTGPYWPEDSNQERERP